MKLHLMILTTTLQLSTCRDFYVGMFKKNDMLVAQDRVFKERVPFRFTVAHYGRIFKCPITYFRVVDRLGFGQGPRVQITRGGLKNKYLNLKLTSPYNQPISVNIYVGCAFNLSPEATAITRKVTVTTTTTSKATTTADVTNGTDTTASGKSDDGVSTPDAKNGNGGEKKADEKKDGENKEDGEKKEDEKKEGENNEEAHKEEPKK